MKVAIVHDWLNTKFGGAENVLIELAMMYPDAPIYTLLYNADVFDGRLDAQRVHSSFLQKLPRWLQQRSRYLLPLIPTATEQFDLSEYDVVISSSSAFVKGVITRPETLHICYCHTPMRFVWDYWPQYVTEQRVDPIRRAAIHLLTSRLRVWDYYSAARVDHWVANSQTTAARIKKYYHQKVDAVIYPGVETSAFRPVGRDQKQDYFITLGSLTPYKKIDLAIEAFNKLGSRLVVVGDGPDRSRLEGLAEANIEFAGRVSDEHRAELMAKAQALIFPNEEDFGIVPVEAMASGTPVIAYGKGGLTETVIEGVTGEFFTEPTAASLIAAIQTFDADRYESDKMAEQAKKFDRARFKQEFGKFVEKQYAELK